MCMMSITKSSSVFKVDDVDQEILQIEHQFLEWIELTEIKANQTGGLIENQIY